LICRYRGLKAGVTLSALETLESTTESDAGFMVTCQGGKAVK
jgi:hypothetical protein